ncbi:hypothetical protein [Pseudonocardia endophytica]|uniref:Uncharacterized protein n=1 Tax=Pseudonocardia endophytica TaxID=401976 RepID=A0A4R1HXI1_PSEEN|nr:hypothetical protein [Pseudonocardia endophytica]TCK27477.1 hypothetical protein EV378_3349 [Pseudonocardia endophytica]
MNSYARTALRVSLAGAGAAALGAGLAGQAFADDEPTPNTDPAALPDTSQVQDNYAPQGGDSADFTDADETASPFPQFPGGGSFSPLQTVPTPQGLLDTENVQNFLTPDGQDIAKVVSDPLALQHEG